MPINHKEKILLCALESSYGVDPSPVASDGMLVKDLELMPMEGEDVERDLELPYLGSQGTIPVNLHMKLTFMVEIAGSGAAGTAPAWSNALRACGVAQTIDAGTSVTYNPVSDGHESAAFYFWNGPTRYTILGARGTCALRFATSGIPYLEFEFTGLWQAPSEAARVTPTNFSSFQAPKEVNTVNTPTFTLGGTSLVMRSLTMSLGNQIEPRFLVGAEAIVLPDRAETIETTVEAVPIATFNPFAPALSAANVPVVLTHGTAAGNIVTLNAPFAQMQRPTGLENQQNITEWPLRLVPRPELGNDQWTLVLT